jgi:neutral ceramidase
MRVGTAEVNITPPPKIDLAGFAVREQPCQGVFDPLWLRVVYIEDGAEKLLWVHGDVLAFDENLVRRFRDWIQAECDITPAQVIIAATHTHSAPATIQLTGCGEVSQEYIDWFEARFHEAVLASMKQLEPCRLVSAEGRCHLGVNRRKPETLHTDPRVGAIGCQRQDGSFKAVILSYSMHPVCLREPRISGDWPGETANCLSRTLPGCPLVIVSSGACGNINPPGVGVSAEQTYRWGRQVAKSVLRALLKAQPEEAVMRMTAANVDLPVKSWSRRGIENYAALCRNDEAGHREFGGQFALAIETWRASMIKRLERDEPANISVELRLLAFNRSSFLTVNAEIFSRFSELMNAKTHRPVYVVGCANGMIGYVPSAEAYVEGGYEVAWSMLFYNQPRLQKGGLELLARHAGRLLEGLSMERLSSSRQCS